MSYRSVELVIGGNAGSERDVLAENSARINAKKHIADVRLVERVERVPAEPHAMRTTSRAEIRQSSPRVAHRHTVFELDEPGRRPEARSRRCTRSVPIPQEIRAPAPERSSHRRRRTTGSRAARGRDAMARHSRAERSRHRLKANASRSRRLPVDRTGGRRLPRATMSTLQDGNSTSFTRAIDLDSVVFALGPRTSVLNHVRFGIDRDNAFEERSQRAR